MSGDATEAYSFLLQALNTCSLHDGHHSGRTDIKFLANTLLEVFDDSRRNVGDLPKGEKKRIPNLDVVLFGWSWRKLQFQGYSYRYDLDGTVRMSRLDKLKDDKAYGVHFFGDGAAEAERRLRKLKRDRGLPVVRENVRSAAKAAARTMFLNWEPVEVLLDIIADKTAWTVGGVPQIIEIGQYGEAESFVWQANDGQYYFGGRPVLPLERYDRRIMKMEGQAVIKLFSDRSMTSSRNPDAAADD